jgi:hypothetical protein
LLINRAANPSRSSTRIAKLSGKVYQALNTCCTPKADSKYLEYVLAQDHPVKRDKRQELVAIANRRVNGVLEEIPLIGNLSNRSAYEYTEEDVRKINRALQRELEVMHAKFEGPGKGVDTDFSL